MTSGLALTLGYVDPLAAVVLVAVAVAVASTVAWRLSESQQRRLPVSPESVVPAGAAAVLSILRSSALLVGADDTVLQASAPAHLMGLVSGARMTSPELIDLVHQVRRDGQIREVELQLPAGRNKMRYVVARVAALSSQLTLALVDDRTRERRVEEVRRDFAVNVSHELKTPVGALSLLAEAVEEAADDPDAVRRFGARMQLESQRLSVLVQRILDLSRVQGDNPLEDVDIVSVDDLAERALDRVRVDAAQKRIQLSFAGARNLHVMGNRDQLTVALGNLVENAVAYSESGTRVTISAQETGHVTEISVTDQGSGIPPAELDRIFERFYRVDPARARTTGGTGLGLSIVKHIAATHSGDVAVWSAEGRGSTFSLKLPSAEPRVPAADRTTDSAPQFPIPQPS